MTSAGRRRLAVLLTLSITFGLRWWLPSAEWAEDAPAGFPATIGPFSLFEMVVCLNPDCAIYGRSSLDISKTKVLGCPVCRAPYINLPLTPPPPAHQRHHAGHYLFSDTGAEPVLLKSFMVESRDLNVLSVSSLGHLYEQGFVRVRRPEGLSTYIGRVGKLPHRLDIMTNAALMPGIGRDWDDIILASWYGQGETATPHRSVYLAQELWRRLWQRKAEPLRHTIVWTHYDAEKSQRSERLIQLARFLAD